MLKKKERKGDEKKSSTFLLKKSNEFLQEKLQTLQLCRKAQTRHNEINQKHKLGKVPKAVLITQGQFSLHSAGGIRVVDCTTQPTLSITPAPKQCNKAATGRIQRIRASRKTALLI